jgi:hypothetical protein
MADKSRRRLKLGVCSVRGASLFALFAILLDRHSPASAGRRLLRLLFLNSLSWRLGGFA